MKTYGPTTQCTDTLYQISKLSARPNSCPQPKSPLYICLINDCQSDVTSTHRHLAQAVDRPSSVALPGFCNQQN